MKNQNILICPLEWGLGHATRMMPLAIKLRDLNNTIFIGAGQEHLSFFRNEVPGLKYVDFPGFKPAYSRYFPQYFSLLLKIPCIIYHSILEHSRLKKIIREHSIDMVISDNRFGLWNRKVKTVYITHMPRIPFPESFSFLEFIGILIHRSIIRKYDFCFIPDLPGELNVSGRLSHDVKLPDNTSFIGLLSRFSTDTPDKDVNPYNFKYNTVILSGPEPQRGILRQKLASVFKDREPVTLFLEGKPDNENEMSRSRNIISLNHLTTTHMKEVIRRSEIIISRSGYSTIMELISVNRTAVLIPTPGQTEQEYLGRYLEDKGWFRCVLQKNINADIPTLTENRFPSGEMIEQSKILLDNALRNMGGD